MPSKGRSARNTATRPTKRAQLGRRTRPRRARRLAHSRAGGPRNGVIGSTPTVPISIALVAGGLAVINPCGFPLLPAFLSYYLGADEQNLPRAPTRLLQGLAVGALVSIGFLGFFAAVGVPISYGAAAIARTVPWVG